MSKSQKDSVKEAWVLRHQNLCQVFIYFYIFWSLHCQEDLYFLLIFSPIILCWLENRDCWKQVLNSKFFFSVFSVMQCEDECLWDAVACKDSCSLQSIMKSAEQRKWVLCISYKERVTDDIFRTLSDIHDGVF